MTQGILTDGAPAALGERCRVELETHFGVDNAALRVDCAGQRIHGYGSFGSVACETDWLQEATRCDDPLRIDQDGDARVTFDREAGRLRLDDGERWALTLALRE